MAEKKLDEVRIGDFSQPIVPPRQPGTTKEVLETAERKLDAEASAIEAEIRPMASYEERLKEVGVTREEAAKIINAIMTKGFYSEEISITKTFRARFRTRSKKDTSRAQNYVEAQRPAFDVHFADLMTHSLLAASLEQLGAEKFEHPTRNTPAADVEKLYNDRFLFVEALADPIYRMLANKLATFDRKVATVLEEGAIENF